MKITKKFWIIAEVYERKVFTNPVRICKSIKIDKYLKFLDLVDIKKCTFSKEKAAIRKLAKLKKIFMEQHIDNIGYMSRCYIKTKEEFNSYLSDLFDRYWKVRELEINIDFEFK